MPPARLPPRLEWEVKTLSRICIPVFLSQICAAVSLNSFSANLCCVMAFTVRQNIVPPKKIKHMMLICQMQYFYCQIECECTKNALASTLALDWTQRNQEKFWSLTHPATRRTIKIIHQIAKFTQKIPAGCFSVTWFVLLTSSVMITPLSCQDQAQSCTCFASKSSTGNAFVSNMWVPSLNAR